MERGTKLPANRTAAENARLDRRQPGADGDHPARIPDGAADLRQFEKCVQSRLPFWDRLVDKREDESVNDVVGEDLPTTTDSQQTAVGADLGSRAIVYQAIGSLAAQLHCSGDEALLRLKAYAFSHDQSITDVAQAVMDRKLHPEPDHPHEGPFHGIIQRKHYSRRPATELGVRQRIGYCNWSLACTT